LNVVVEAAQAESTVRNAAFGFANVLTMTTIVSRLHERRRVLSGLAVESMFAMAGKSGLDESAKH
jgi:hypothetical protein